MQRPFVSIHTSDYAAALKVAEKFNIAAQARPSRKVAAVLHDAVDFLGGTLGEIAKGNLIVTGSGWHGPDPFLDKSIGLAIARKKSGSDYLTGDVDVTLTKRDKAALSDIRKTFSLSSDKQAAELALRVYDYLTDGLWRGNGFGYWNRNSVELDTDKIKMRLFPQTP